MSMNLYNFDLFPILLALIVITSVVLWVAIKNYKNFVLMFFLIPLALYSGWTIYTTIDRLLGYPVVDVLEKDTQYVMHYESPDISDWIYVWVLKPGESKPKAIMIPATEPNQSELAEAEQKKSQGVQVFMEMKKGEGQTAGGELNTYDFQQNWGTAEKEEQRNRDAAEELERLRENPGPVTPRAVPGPAPRRDDIDTTSDRPTRLDSIENPITKKPKNTKIWRDSDDMVNPYGFEIYEDDGDYITP